MSLAELKEQAAALPPADQRELSVFLEYLLENRPSSEPISVARKIDEQDPAKWISWDDVKRDLNR